MSSSRYYGRVENEPNPNRVFLVGRPVLEALTSQAYSERFAGFDTLPWALTSEEVESLALQIDTHAGDDEIADGVVADTLTCIGHMALYHRSDIITAERIAGVLLRRVDLVAAAWLAGRAWLVQRDIVRDMTG